MEVFTTLLLFAGLLIMWIAQNKSRKEEHAKYVKPQKQNIPLSDLDKPITLEMEENLNGVMEEIIEDDEPEVSPRDKIDSLSTLKRAVIWSEILNKPLSERDF